MATPSIRVLLVDDFEPFRRFLSSALQARPTLQIVGEASDGLEAVQMAAELQPDLIVLDIRLPKLNGIDAARRIREVAPQSKILFVSQESSADLTREALRLGAAGYVVKTDVGRELMTAVDTVLRGERFVGNRFWGSDFATPLGTQAAEPIGGQVILPPPLQHGRSIANRHEAEFYSDDQPLLHGFAQFVSAALNAGHSAIVVATAAHRESLLQRLHTQVSNLSVAVAQGRYLSLDVTETLSSFMVNQRLDPARFLKVIGDLILTAAQVAKGKHPRVATCGECAPLLWEGGNAEAAIQLEQLWNEVCKVYELDVLCGYRLASFQGRTRSYTFERLCAEHSAVHSR